MQETKRTVFVSTSALGPARHHRKLCLIASPISVKSEAISIWNQISHLSQLASLLKQMPNVFQTTLFPCCGDFPLLLALLLPCAHGSHGKACVLSAHILLQKKKRASKTMHEQTEFMLDF